MVPDSSPPPRFRIAPAVGLAVLATGAVALLIAGIWLAAYGLLIGLLIVGLVWLWVRRRRRGS